MPGIRAAFVANRLHEASARLRLGQYVSRLPGFGVRADLHELPGGPIGRLAFFRTLGAYDVVLLHRKLLGTVDLAFLRRHARRLVFDFDDAIPWRDSFQGAVEVPRRRRRFQAVIRRADGIVPGNRHLEHLARQAAPACKTLVLPTPVDLEKYETRPPTTAEEGPPTLRLGWIGQASTLPYLEDILPALESAAKEVPGLRLRVIADAFPNSHNLPLETILWTETGEAAALGDIDIGIMPLRDDPWARGKCGYKILQYFAAGKPVIASPVGINADLVGDGKRGVLATNRDEWRSAILNLSYDRMLRDKLGDAGHALITSEGHDIDPCSEKLARFLIDIAG